MYNIYIFESDGYYKVGITNNIKKRMKTLQGGNPHKISLVNCIQVEDFTMAIRYEQRFHKILKRYSVLGEWFKVPKEQSLVFEGIFDSIGEQNAAFLKEAIEFWKLLEAK